MLAAVMVALTGVIGIVMSSVGSKSETVAALATAAHAVKPSPVPAAPPQPAVRPPSTSMAAVTPVTSAQPSGLVDSAKLALAAEDKVSVTVHVSPPNAAVFMRGHHFGTGQVTVKVVRGTKTTLFAQLGGYLPRTVVVDGTSKDVHIVLKRPQSARVAAARTPPAQEAVASLPESESPAKSADTAVADTPSNAGASNPEPTKRSPSQAAGSMGSEPISDVDPL